MDSCPQDLKRHARLRYRPDTPVLWVGDPEDWEVVRRDPRPALVCPEPGCGVELISYENPRNVHNPRIFKFKAGGRSCRHWIEPGRGGGPESAQHQWMKLRLIRIARHLGYTATPEHPHTRADVFVHEPRVCLEVQLVPTDFGKRTLRRQAAGATVCWLVQEGLRTRKANRAVFETPALRFRIIDKDNPRGAAGLQPWEHTRDAESARRARLWVFGTVAVLRNTEPDTGAATRASRFGTQGMSGYQFLKEVFEEERCWYGPGTLGHPSGLWARRTDVTSYTAAMGASTSNALPSPRPAPATIPPAPTPAPPATDVPERIPGPVHGPAPLAVEGNRSHDAGNIAGGRGGTAGGPASPPAARRSYTGDLVYRRTSWWRFWQNR